MVGEGISQPLTVTGEAVEISEDEALAQAVEGYVSYVRTQVASLESQTDAFVAAIEDGDQEEYRGTEGPIIPETAHVRLASPHSNNGAAMLRRSYNFTDGVDEFGHMDSGLFFIAMVNSPKQRFIPIQSNLSKNDEMNEYVPYGSSAIFACPPGTKDDKDWWAREMFETTA
ncbi:Dyp-type peroxidase domain-containing protein [Corynebacterium phocae]|nr:Dyp-type peroxidase domain-containing protein [Corynebacterium phocae]KAA8723190.1 hypothetical protein F4V58_07710 [Corynebacterium phocae]